MRIVEHYIERRFGAVDRRVCDRAANASLQGRQAHAAFDRCAVAALARTLPDDAQACPHGSTAAAVKGMNDILPPDSARWEWFEARCATLMRRYGYPNVRTPIVEPTALFVRGLGEVTDIVEKEMYSFVDAMNGDRADAAPRGHRRRRARDHRTLAAVRRRQAALLHRPDVPPRAAAEGTLSAVPPGRRRGARLRRARTSMPS